MLYGRSLIGQLGSHHRNGDTQEAGFIRVVATTCLRKVVAIEIIRAGWLRVAFAVDEFVLYVNVAWS